MGPATRAESRGWRPGQTPRAVEDNFHAGLRRAVLRDPRAGVRPDRGLTAGPRAPGSSSRIKEEICATVREIGTRSKIALWHGLLVGSRACVLPEPHGRWWPRIAMIELVEIWCGSVLAMRRMRPVRPRMRIRSRECRRPVLRGICAVLVVTHSALDDGAFLDGLAFEAGARRARSISWTRCRTRCVSRVASMRKATSSEPPRAHERREVRGHQELPDRSGDS